MGIGDTIKNHVNPDVIVGREPHSLRNNLKYAQSKADSDDLYCWLGKCLMLSIHADKSTETDKRGAIAYYNPSSQYSKEFADSIVSCFGGRAIPDTSNRYGRLAVTRDVENVQGVLLEVGNLSNAQDLAFLKKEAGSKLAKCLGSMFRSMAVSK